jgi:hypothetical protein
MMVKADHVRSVRARRTQEAELLNGAPDRPAPKKSLEFDKEAIVTEETWLPEIPM